MPEGCATTIHGNINFAGQKGATKEGGANGRFAVFGSMGDGLTALFKQIGLHVTRADPNARADTIRKLVYKWAPPSDGNNSSAYVDYVSKMTGIAPDQKLDMSNQAQMTAIAKAIVMKENGGIGNITDNDLIAGYVNASAGRKWGNPTTSRLAQNSTQQNFVTNNAGQTLLTNVAGSSTSITPSGQTAVDRSQQVAQMNAALGGNNPAIDISQLLATAQQTNAYLAAIAANTKINNPSVLLSTPEQASQAYRG